MKQITRLVLVRELKRPKKDTLFIVGEDLEINGWTVPTGFESDLTSVPVGFRNLISQLTYPEAAVLHDWFYRTGAVSRERADDIYFKLLKGAVPGWKRWLIWSGLRVGGWANYKGGKA